MLNYLIKFKAGAKSIEREQFEQWIPMVFRIVEEINTDTNEIKIYDTRVEFTGSPCWSEQKATSIAINHMQRMARKDY